MPPTIIVSIILFLPFRPNTGPAGHIFTASLSCPGSRLCQSFWQHMRQRGYAVPTFRDCAADDDELHSHLPPGRGCFWPYFRKEPAMFPARARRHCPCCTTAGTAPFPSPAKSPWNKAWNGRTGCPSILPRATCSRRAYPAGCVTTDNHWWRRIAGS